LENVPERRGNDPLPLPLGSDREPVAVSEETDAAQADLILTAVRNWQKESNGRLSAAIFQTARPVADDELSVALLRSLPLECCRERDEAELWTGQVPPAEAFDLLFSAAATGGAYNSGLSGAYGRLAAWQSVAGLVGAPPGADAKRLVRLAKRCLWASFCGPPWFADIAWDLGLIAVRPDRRSLAVLAATDTD
jgi:hypothetical protein